MPIKKYSCFEIKCKQFYADYTLNTLEVVRKELFEEKYDNI